MVPALQAIDCSRILWPIACIHYVIITPPSLAVLIQTPYSSKSTNSDLHPSNVQQETFVQKEKWSFNSQPRLTRILSTIGYGESMKAMYLTLFLLTILPSRSQTAGSIS